MLKSVKEEIWEELIKKRKSGENREMQKIGTQVKSPVCC